MKIKRFLLIIYICHIIYGITCAAAFGDIRIHGSSTIFPIVQSAAEPFKKKTGISIELKGGGSENGIKAVLENRADICMVSRELLPSDPRELTSFNIGYDGIALIVNRAVPVDEITTQQVVDIYSGKIIDWRPISGKSQPVTIISKYDGHGTKTIFDMFFGLEGKITPNTVLFHSNDVSIAMVSSDPNAIGYVSVGSAEHALELGLQLKILKLNGVIASSENVTSGKYPLRRAINLVTLGEPGPEAEQFIRFIQSSAGQQYVRMHHFVPISGGVP